MKKARVMSAFLSLTMGMTSLAGVPMAVNAESVDKAKVESADVYSEYIECTEKVAINVRDYDSGAAIENVNVIVYEGYDRKYERFSFNTSDKDANVIKFEYYLQDAADKAVYEIVLENLPEEYNFTDNTTSWMLPLDYDSAEKYEGKTYNYNLDIHPVISDKQGTGTRPATTSVPDLTTTGTTSDPNLRWDYYDFRGPNGDPNYRPTTTTLTTTENATVTTSEKSESSLSFERERYDLEKGHQYILKLNNPDFIKMDYEVEDRNIASEKFIYPTYVYVYADISGTTKITAIGENGETAEAVINVFDPVTTATTTTGTGTVTTTETVTAYVRTSPTAIVKFDDINSLYIKPNEIKDFPFSASFASEVEFKSDSPDIKIVDVDYEGGDGLGSDKGNLVISCKHDAEPHGITLYAYANSGRGEYAKSMHSLMIVDDSFTPTTTLNPNATTTSSTTWSTRTTYVTADNTSSAEKSGTTTKGSTTNTTTSTTTTMSHITTLYPGTTIALDYGTVTNYDNSPLRVGESRKIYFRHPREKNAALARVDEDKCLTYRYIVGDDFITVTAVKEGRASMYITAEGCAFSGSVSFDIIPADAEIITALYEGLTNIYQTEGQNTITTDMIAPYHICDQGSNLNLILFAEIEDAEGRKEIRQIQITDEDELTIKSQAIQYYTNKDFKNLNAGRYLLYLGNKEESFITIGNDKYYLRRDFGDMRDPVGAIHLYINEEDNTRNYVRIKPTKVLSAVYTHGDTGLSFKGIDTKFRIDADSEMHIDWNMPSLYAGDTVNGVLYVNGNYVISGDLDIIGRGGDANCDDEINMADAVLIMQALANPDKYGQTGTNDTHITAQGVSNADTTDDGMTNADALAIQKRLLGLH